MKISTKKIVIYTFLLLLIGVGTKNIYKNFHKKLPSLKESFTEDSIHAKLVEHKILKKCYNAGHINSNDLIEYIAQEGFDYNQENKKIVLDSLAKLSNKDTNTEERLKIPPITHRMYFSSKKKPIKLNDFYIAMLKNSFIKLNSVAEGWEHNIWTNMPELFPDEIKEIKGVKIRSVEEFKDHQLYQTLIHIINKGENLRGHFAQASDLFRIMVVQKLGGFYSDMDYEIYHPSVFLSLIRKFDFIGARDDNGYYANGFIAAKPNHPILNKAIELEIRNNNLAKNAKIPNAVKYPCSDYQKIYFSGPPLLTVAYFSKNNIDGNSDLVLPSWMSLNYDVARYKNKYCKYDRITKEELKTSNDNLEPLLADFTKNFKQEDSIASYNKNKIFKDYEQNIFYDLKYRNDFSIIGADMGCGNWSDDPKGLDKKYYWNFKQN